MIDGLASSKRYNLSSSSRIGMRLKRRRSTENSPRIIGKVSKSECRISLKLISKTQELPSMKETPCIEVSSLRKQSTIKNIMKYSIKIKSLRLIKKFRKVIGNKIFLNLKSTLKFEFIEKNLITFSEKNKLSFSKRLCKRWRK